MRKLTLFLVALALALGAAPAPASTVLGLGIEDQARLARLVVLGQVVSLEGEDHPELGLETRVGLLVRETLKGDVASGAVVVFHTHEGAVAGAESQAPGEARFNVGQSVLVFIEDVDGRLYNLGLSMGVWSVHEREGAVSGYTRALTDGLEVVGPEPVEHGPIAHRDMVARVAWATTHPEFDSPLLRAARLRGGE